MFKAKVLELPHRDFVVYVKRNLNNKDSDLKEDLKMIWNKFSK